MKKKAKTKITKPAKPEVGRVVFLMPLTTKDEFLAKVINIGSSKAWVLNKLVTKYLNGEIKL